ncbi:phosphotransferase enzyme family protein [Tunturiibacter lichenicola]|uniref:phosphotransferase enzyme family protein n=1 Tax=Tunturiibacter lichenicola TaxID=2051959 RepID=UPI0021B2ED7D|nr:phosphotransferase [Edaphobacter lichenicola]
MRRTAMSDLEERLYGGNVADSVVRVGATVRKPVTAATSSVEAFLEHLFEAGFGGAPRTLGRDEKGRHVLEYVPGATEQPFSYTNDELVRVGRLIREFHAAASSFVPPVGAQWLVAIKPDSESMICHNDLAPWNLVRGGERWVFIDWDGSGPGSVLWDVAYAAQSFVPLIHGGGPAVDALRLRCLVDGYRLDRSQRERLPEMMAARTRAMFELGERAAMTGEQPWARIHAEGDGGRHWKQAAEYVERHLDVWRDALLVGLVG